jgi:hypothetical protein
MQRRCGVRWNLPRAREKIPEVGCWHCSIGSAALIVHWLRALKESAVDKNIAVHR